MPRPKVPPGHRKRAAEACASCRVHKKKCSGTVPCIYCIRRGLEASCSLTHRPRGAAVGNSSVASAAPTPTPIPGFRIELENKRPGEVGLQKLSSITPVPTQQEQEHEGDGCVDVAPLGFSSETRAVASESLVKDASEQGRLLQHVSSSTAREPNPRMLLNSRGELVYIGGAASISFLQLIREIVAENIGPSQFSHNDKNDSMLETQSREIPADPMVPAVIDLSIEQKLLFSRVFSQATEGFHSIFSSSEIEGLLLGSNNNNSPFIKPCKRATIELIIAIGAQCHSLESAERIGKPYFRQAQLNAFSGMLEDPNVDMVRAFILMAFYMLGDCRRNSAFMYLGIATRAAVALGLHSRDSYADMKSPKYKLRLQIWLSLCILDLLVSTILGRPSATSGLRTDLSCDLDIISASSPDADIAWLVASYKILQLSNDVVKNLYEKKQISVTIVEQMLLKIEAWSQSLPNSLRKTFTVSPISAPPAPTGTIGSIHISCLYYFAVTLVTRPMLISTLTDRSAHPTPQHFQLASACLDAAVYLVQACYDAYKSQFLLGNMCIMKALLFAAGLILGFEMFAKREMDYGIETAFRRAREVLDFLAVQSPQAAHYSEILTLLSKAVDRRREKLLDQGRSKYVSRILPTGGEVNTGMESHRLHEMANQESVTSVSAQYGPVDQQGEVFCGWDSLDLSQWDNFPYLEPKGL